MATANFKVPPSLQKSVLCEFWLKELSCWQVFMDIGKIKQGQAVFLSFEGKACKSVLELDVKNINTDATVDNIIACLDKLYFKNKTQTAYETYEKFAMYRQPNDISISNFITEFERLLNKTEQYGSNMPSDILAYIYQKQLTFPDILNSQYHEDHFMKMSWLATISEQKYEVMKTQLKKIFVTVQEAAVLKTSCWT